MFKTEKQNGRQIHYKMYYYSIYPEPLSWITLVYISKVVIYPKAIHCVYLNRFNHLQLFYY